MLRAYLAFAVLLLVLWLARYCYIGIQRIRRRNTFTICSRRNRDRGTLDSYSALFDDRAIADRRRGGPKARCRAALQ